MGKNVTKTYFFISEIGSVLNYDAIVIVVALVLMFKIGNYLKLRLSFGNYPSCAFEPYLFWLWISGNIPKDMPFTAVLFCVVTTLCKHFEKEGIFVLWGIDPVLVLLKEEYVKIFAGDSSIINKPFEYDIIEEMTGRGILTANGSRWKERRKMFNPAFRFEVLKSHMTIMNDAAALMVKQMTEFSDRPTTKILDILQEGALKIIIESTLGIRMISEKTNKIMAEYLEILSSLEEYTIYRLPRPWLWGKKRQLLFQAGRKHRNIYKEHERIIRAMVQEMIKLHSKENSLEKEGKYHNAKSFPSILLENYTKNPNFSMEDLEYEVSTFIFEGHDTTTYTTLWCLFMLGLYPEVQEKAYGEVESTVETSPLHISYSDLNKMQYLDSVIKETLRLYPTIPMYGRQITKDIVCGKYKVPKNTTVGFVPYIMHRNPKFFPNPEHFDPDRFYMNSLKHPWAYLPFSEGNRSCIGKRFAIMEIKIILAHMLSNYVIVSLDKREDIQVDWKILTKPWKPIRFKFIPRHPSSLPQG